MELDNKKKSLELKKKEEELKKKEESLKMREEHLQNEQFNSFMDADSAVDQTFYEINCSYIFKSIDLCCSCISCKTYSKPCLQIF